MTDKRSLGRRCAVCGEPVTEHYTRSVSAHERVFITRRARSRAEANALVRAASRVCPLVSVDTEPGQPPRWVPRRLAAKLAA